MKLKIFRVIIFVIFSFQFVCADEWYSAPSLHIPRGGAAAVTHENFIYVFGGKSFNNKVLNSVERYDLSLGIWDTSYVHPFKYPRFNATAVVFDGKIYLMGGQNGESILREVEIYDPAQNEWTDAQKLRRDRAAFAGAVFNNRIYAIGGKKDYYTLIDEIEWYDHPADDWLDAVFDLPYPRAAHFYSVSGDTFYMFGGFYYDPTRTAYKAIKGPNGYEWEQLPDLYYSRAYGAATVSRGNIYIIGGETSSGKTNTIEVFLIETETYGSCEPITSPRSGLAAVTVKDTIIYAIGGFETDYNDPVSTVEWYHGDLYTSIDDQVTAELPIENILINGYPNPFNNSIELELLIPENGIYRLDIYNISGQKILNLFNGNINRGSNTYKWRVESNISSGIYFVVVKSDKYFQKYKMLYVK